jgi:hypothetical protein
MLSVFTWNDDNPQGFDDMTINNKPADFGDMVEYDLDDIEARRLLRYLQEVLDEGNHVTINVRYGND